MIRAPTMQSAYGHLATSNRGVIMLRKMLARAIDAVRLGDDPVGIVRDPARELVTTTAGNTIVDAVPPA